ncbi:YbjQ family protein [Bacteroides intestinalis]|jgi:uncharacterized protein YbjQ (UPF0145 family)|uniref:YbjQ family protein n=1 Tax=Bacteroides intestinalis TaxID=329854 RepID=UPI000E4BF3EB|nr:YbjQ family protein [Bacteroides intestinalis]RGX84512.1 YbjQ family protein [Bacteroides intestinalis]
MIITTTNNIENHSIKRYLGVINANIVIGANFFSDFAASLTDVFGGRSNTYQNKLNTIYKDVMAELEEKAKYFQADAIVGLHIDFDEVSGGGKSMFMVSASGTAVMIESNFEDRYFMYKALSDIHDYWTKGFLSEEEYNYEKARIIEKYNSAISEEIKVVKETKEYEAKRLKEQEEQKAHAKKIFEEKLYEAKKNLENRCPCSEEVIKATTPFQIQAADYDSISYNTNDSMESIIAKFIRLNKIPEACKYYIDETGLSENDAIEYVLDTFKKIDVIDKEVFEKLLNKLKVLKSKGFIEQAINEYQKFTLSERDIAEIYINTL